MKRNITFIIAVATAICILGTLMVAFAAQAQPSDVQVVERGGSNTSDDGSVTVSKTIAGTDIENVFDITLTAQLEKNIDEIVVKPDMAIVIVLDCSNTMITSFGNTSRYKAANAAAKDFISKFATGTSSNSKIGLVTFNTSSYEAISLRECNTSSDVSTVQGLVDSTVEGIILAENYANDNNRFTNVEAGIKRAADALKNAGNPNKYIIFLSDGFPTTYINSGYEGYVPVSTAGTPGEDGVFYDMVESKYCIYGTNYSDKAAIRARLAASEAKGNGIKIFSIGIDVGGQTIDQYVEQSGQTYSIVDRTDNTNYEIGLHNSADAYKNWLKTGIGSDVYYDSTNQSAIEDAYDSIFAEIVKETTEKVNKLWIATDPIPTAECVDFIGFFDKSGALKSSLTGTFAQNGENQASYANSKISWDLKKSGYTTGTSMPYTYTLKYRVRLENEKLDFAEAGTYLTNGATNLTYAYLTDNGIKDGSVSYQPIPSVKGYIVNFEFTKLEKVEGIDDTIALPLKGAEFTLTHDRDNCPACNSTLNRASEIPEMTATSDEDGKVVFENVPSGHTYILTEKVCPTGYYTNGDTYRVSVDYDAITVTITHADGTTDVIKDSFNNIINLRTPEPTATPTIAPTEEPTATPTEEPTPTPTTEPTPVPEPPKPMGDNGTIVLFALVVVGVFAAFIIWRKKTNNC